MLSCLVGRGKMGWVAAPCATVSSGQMELFTRWEWESGVWGDDLSGWKWRKDSRALLFWHTYIEHLVRFFCTMLRVDRNKCLRERVICATTHILFLTRLMVFRALFHAKIIRGAKISMEVHILDSDSTITRKFHVYISYYSIHAFSFHVSRT